MGLPSVWPAIAGKVVVSFRFVTLINKFLTRFRFNYYEHLADVQMLAMLSCALSVSQRSSQKADEDQQRPGLSSTDTSLNGLNWPWNSTSDYYPSEEVAKAQLQPPSPNFSVRVDYQNTHSGPHSSTSSTGAPISELSTSNTPPSNYKPLRTSFERRDSQATSLSSSPEHLRRTHRSSSNLSALAASFSRPFSFSSSVASSPPNTYPKKRLSPAGSYLGTPSSTSNWSPAFLGRSSTITEDPRSSLTLSTSDSEDDNSHAPKKLGFTTKLKNQDQFYNESYANIPLLDPSEEWRHFAYRVAYARLLCIWGMPVASAEILKFNHLPAAGSSPPHASPQNPASLLTIGKPSRMNRVSDTEAADLGFRAHCRSCSSTTPRKPANRRCQTCFTKQVPPICVLCDTLVRGHSSPCLNCGHTLHDSCRQIFCYTQLDLVANASECTAGCGCICANYNTAGVVNLPDQAVTQSYDVSPAITVVGDAGLDIQEQLGWREEHLNEEWEDVAYQSLAQNLRPRQEVRAKSSQIWKGRIGNL